MINIAEQNQQHFWHPCSQMKDHETFKPLMLNKAYGSYLELNDGRKIIDAISSWWCKSLGHQHPRLKHALLQQLEKFEHVISANTTNTTIIELSRKLAQLAPGLDKVFYAGDGSCAVEIALKMSLHYHLLTDNPHRKQFLALQNDYHGETVGALSVSDVGRFRQPYESLLFKANFIPHIPYVNSMADPLWEDCSSVWPAIENFLNNHIDTTAAVIVEPIVQGVNGMKIYSADFLRRLRHWTSTHGIHLIADEIMTGLGRTGKMLACEHANITPDFICLSKGLTAGWLAFSAVITSTKIYQAFYDDDINKAFLHSHTFSGNALAASVALETLKILSEDKMCERATQLGTTMLQFMQEIADATGQLKNVRGIGAIVAADLINTTDKLLAKKIYQKAIELGALLRPLGNTLYWLPPLNMESDTLIKLKEITQQAILSVCS